MQDLRSSAAPLRAASDNTRGRSQPFRLSAFLAQKLRVLTCPGTTSGDVAAEDKGLFLRNAFQVLQLQGTGRRTLKACKAGDGYPNLCMVGFLEPLSHTASSSSQEVLSSDIKTFGLGASGPTSQKKQLCKSLQGVMAKLATMAAVLVVHFACMSDDSPLLTLSPALWEPGAQCRPPPVAATMQTQMGHRRLHAASGSRGGAPTFSACILLWPSKEAHWRYDLCEPIPSDPDEGPAVMRGTPAGSKRQHPWKVPTVPAQCLLSSEAACLDLWYHNWRRGRRRQAAVSSVSEERLSSARNGA